MRCIFEDVTCFAGLIAEAPAPVGIGLVIQPQNGTAIGQLCFLGCTFEPGSDMGITSTSPGPGILIDANGGFIDTARLVSCYSNRWTGPGLSVGTSGGTGAIQNIEVLGGMYAGNNFSTGPSAYGIAVYGPSTAVRIVGVSCVGHYKFIQIDSASTSTQQDVGIFVDDGSSNVIISACDCRENAVRGIYVNGGASEIIIEACDATANGTNGIYIDAASTAVADIFVRDCNVQGYAAGYTAAINVTGSGSNVSTVQVTNCAGYNDQGVVLKSGGTPPISGTPFYGYTLPTPYFGPYEFYTAPNSATISQIYVQGTVTTIVQGSFYIPAGQSAQINWSPSGIFSPTFVAIGK